MAFGVGEKERGKRLNKINFGSRHRLHCIQNCTVVNCNIADD